MAEINEEWRDIPGFENYQVSSLGRVKSLERKVKNRNGYKTISERILKPHKDRKGYFSVIIYKKGKIKNFRIHRLVATAFLSNPDNLPQINHKNECKTDNRVENLEYCDAKYNCNFGNRNKKITKSNINNTKASKAVKCLETGEIYSSAIEIKRKFGFDNGGISKCCNKKIKSCGGLHWEWA